MPVGRPREDAHRCVLNEEDHVRPGNPRAEARTAGADGRPRTVERPARPSRRPATRWPTVAETASTKRHGSRRVGRQASRVASDVRGQGRPPGPYAPAAVADRGRQAGRKLRSWRPTGTSRPPVRGSSSSPALRTDGRLPQQARPGARSPTFQNFARRRTAAFLLSARWPGSSPARVTRASSPSVRRSRTRRGPRARPIAPRPRPTPGTPPRSRRAGVG